MDWLCLQDSRKLSFWNFKPRTKYVCIHKPIDKPWSGACPIYTYLTQWMNRLWQRYNHCSITKRSISRYAASPPNISRIQLCAIIQVSWRIYRYPNFAQNDNDLIKERKRPKFNLGSLLISKLQSWAQHLTTILSLVRTCWILCSTRK